MTDYKYIRWSIFFITFVIFSLHLTVIVLNDHATTRVSEEIPDYDPHKPRSDVVQASGRIQRDISPLFEKKIVDIYDKFSVFTGQYAKRLQFYKASHFGTRLDPATQKTISD